MKTLIITLSVALFAGAAFAHEEPGSQRLQGPEVKAQQQNQDQGQRVEKGKQALLKQIERLEDKLNRMKEKVDRMQMMDDDSKDELKDLLDEKLEILGNIAEQVKDADTAEELMDVRGDLRAFVHDLKDDWKAKLKEIRSQNFEELLDKTKERLTELRERVDDAEDNGDDVKKADHFLDHCEADIDRAEGHQEADNMKAAASNLKHCYHDFRMVLKILDGEPVEATPENEDSSEGSGS